MTQLFHAIATPRVGFNDGFKAFFGFAVLAMALVGGVLSLFSDSSLSFGLGVICGLVGGFVGLGLRNVYLVDPKR